MSKARDDIYEQAEDLRAGTQALAYEAGDVRQRGGLLYRCVQAHTSQATWTPEDAPSLWTRIADPAQEWPEWIQPTGAHNAYAQGAKVSHGGKRWVSDVDNNVWEPGVYGWTEHIEEGEA